MGSPMASKLARHSWAARTSAAERCASLPSRSRLSFSSSSLRSESSASSRAFCSTIQYWSMALWMVMIRWASSQGFQMKRKISDWLTASSMAVRVGLAGEQHALDARPPLLDRAEELDAAHARHPVVGDHHLDRLLLEELQPGRGVRRVEHPAAGPAQDPAQRAAHVLVVVDDEDGRRAGRLRPGRLLRRLWLAWFTDGSRRARVGPATRAHARPCNPGVGAPATRVSAAPGS